MIKKRYIKKLYIEEVYCDKCGALMRHNGIVLSTYPAQYPFNCTNPNCDGHTTFWGDNVPGSIKYEFEDDNNEEV